MPGHAHPRIDIAGVVTMNVAKGAPQPIGIGRHHDDMHMVGHQAVRPHFGPRRARGVLEQIEIEFIIAILEERPLAPVAALGDVVWDVGDDDSGEAGHGDWLVGFGGYCKCHRNPNITTSRPSTPTKRSANRRRR